MSVVPSVNASSSSVLPAFFAASTSDGAGKRVVSESAEPSVVDSSTFSDVLEKSSRSKTESVSSVNQNDSTRAVETHAADEQRAAGESIGQQVQADSAAEEISQQRNQVVGLTTLANATSGKSDRANSGPTEDPLESLAVNEGEELDVAVNLLAIDSIAGAAISTDGNRPTNAVVADDESELESVQRDVPELEGQGQDNSESNRDELHDAGTQNETLVVDLATANPNANQAFGTVSSQNTESLKQLRTQLETEFNVSPERNRLLSSPSLQSASIQNQQAGATQAVNSVVDAIPSDQRGFVTNQSVVDQAGVVAGGSGAVNPIAISSSDSASLQVTTAAAPEGGDPATLRPVIDGEQNSVSSAKLNNGDVTVYSSQVVSGEIAGQSVRPASAEAVSSSDDSALASSATAGAASTQQVNDDVDTHSVQTNLTGSDAIDAPVRRTAEANITGTGRVQVPVDSPGSTYSNVQSQSFGFDTTGGFVGGQASRDSEFLQTASADDHLVTEQLTGADPAIDSDLDLLQQLLPRETSTPFGQLAESGPDGLPDSFDLPRQIAARAIGEAEVLEAGDSTRFRMKIDPPELGSVMIEMQKTNQGTTITVTAADPATQQLLQDSLQQLNQSDSGEASIFENLAFDLSNGDQADGQDRDGRKSQAEKIRISGGEVAKADSEPDSQTPTELDFVA